MDSQRTLSMLREIDSDERVTQRSLSRRVGISLGLANVYLKRLAKKGYIKITTVPGSRLLRYMLTPQGVKEKTRLTFEFALYSLQFIRDARRHMREQLKGLADAGAKRVAICGTSELAELACLALQELGLELAGVVSASRVQGSFLGSSVIAVDQIDTIDFDAVLAFSEEERLAVVDCVADGRPVLLLTAE